MHFLLAAHFDTSETKMSESIALFCVIIWGGNIEGLEFSFSGPDNKENIYVI